MHHAAAPNAQRAAAGGFARGASASPGSAGPAVGAGAYRAVQGWLSCAIATTLDHFS